MPEVHECDRCGDWSPNVRCDACVEVWGEPGSPGLTANPHRTTL